MLGRDQGGEKQEKPKEGGAVVCWVKPGTRRLQNELEMVLVGRFGGAEPDFEVREAESNHPHPASAQFAPSKQDLTPNRSQQCWVTYRDSKQAKSFLK